MKLIIIFERDNVEYHRREDENFDSFIRAKEYCETLTKSYNNKILSGYYHIYPKLPCIDRILYESV